MSITMQIQNNALNPELARWTREYIQGPKLFEPSQDELTKALKTSGLGSPVASIRSVYESLDSIGVALIIDLLQPTGPGRVAITPALGAEEAASLQDQMMQSSYRQFRQALNISHHWILQLDPQLSHSINDLFDASLYWLHDNAELPECGVLEL